MPIAVYSGRGWVLRIRSTGTRLLPGEPTPVTADEADSLRDHPDVEIRDGETGDGDLRDLSRRELNARAKQAGVTNPEKLSNKDAVIDAMRSAAQEGPGHG